MKNPFTGILIAVFVYAIGGGLIEVLISPIIEACPTDNKEAAMSLLHSFYCWGCTGVVLVSTVFFALVGIGSLENTYTLLDDYSDWKYDPVYQSSDIQSYG